jgi:hypothetical protein
VCCVMFAVSPLRLLTQRGGGAARTRGNPIGEFGVMSVAKAPAVPRHVIESFRLERQAHAGPTDARPHKYLLCTKCGVASVTVNFDAVPSARIGMFGVCEGGKDYTHHKFVTTSAAEYARLQAMTPAERVRWHFQH